MILSDLASPAEAACKSGSDRELAGFAKAGNRFPLFEIMLYRCKRMVRRNEVALLATPLTVEVSQSCRTVALN